MYNENMSVIVNPSGRFVVLDNPKEIGADRIVNTLAAHTLYGGPAIVVDFGTSTNLDVVSPKGEFLGGALAPGIEISVDALSARAAQLRGHRLQQGLLLYTRHRTLYSRRLEACACVDSAGSFADRKSVV